MDTDFLPTCMLTWFGNKIKVGVINEIKSVKSFECFENSDIRQAWNVHMHVCSQVKIKNMWRASMFMWCLIWSYSGFIRFNKLGHQYEFSHRYSTFSFTIWQVEQKEAMSHWSVMISYQIYVTVFNRNVDPSLTSLHWQTNPRGNSCLNNMSSIY